MMFKSRSDSWRHGHSTTSAALIVTLLSDRWRTCIDCSRSQRTSASSTGRSRMGRQSPGRIRHRRPAAGLQNTTRDRGYIYWLLYTTGAVTVSSHPNCAYSKFVLPASLPPCLPAPSLPSASLSLSLSLSPSLSLSVSLSLSLSLWFLLSFYFLFPFLSFLLPLLKSLHR